MELNKILKKVDLEVTKMFADDSTGHDISHLKRVKDIALKIQEREGGNKIVIAISAMLHDVHRLMSEERDSYVTPKESLDTIKTLLTNIDLEKSIVDNVLHCIEFHEEYNFSKNGITVTDIETLILQDADNLDAIGAIGIIRNNMYCGHYSIPMWLPEIPYNQSTFEEGHIDVSMIHHYYHKLLKLKDNMNTRYGKEMAEGRHEFMLKFLEEFFAEWNGEK